MDATEAAISSRSGPTDEFVQTGASTELYATTNPEEHTMPTRESVPAGAPIWIDLTTSDQPASRAFYAELLGWESEEPDPELGGYLNFSRGGERVAGCVPTMPGAPTDVWTVYLATDDAERTCKEVTAAGGSVHAPAMAVHDLGSMAVVADPGGAGVGLWQPGSHRGLLTVAEPGHAAWFELLTRNYEATVAFYRDVFGWEIQTMADTPEFRYSVGSLGGEEQAGLMDAGDTRPEGATGVGASAPAQWTVYFAVADADRDAARAVELGASTVHPPEDSPYGRLAALTDPTGALFKLVAGS